MRRKLVALMVIAAAALGSSASPASASMAQPESVAAAATTRLQNYASGKCLIVRGSATYTQAVLYPCRTYSDQYWYFDSYQGSNYFRLRNAKSNLCLVPATNAPEAAVVQVPCITSATNQVWSWEPNSRGTFLRNYAYWSKCMFIRGSANETGARIQHCSVNYSDQQWRKV
ncbi:hypothetical protein GCM10029963_75620 [Micromonospora andamanensis]|uniref:RICIN domain-containing protein n=1 Tax=Micromonospora andamanensis TaxID=1287068 RepID=UPI00195061FB|nr:RICIN domain-containing protein [Micromonospora andamanensis]GIJ41173.1 hypothetical protein Vwe01_44980 [Micromonospora andamanensis]